MTTSSVDARAASDAPSAMPVTSVVAGGRSAAERAIARAGRRRRHAARRDIAGRATPTSPRRPWPLSPTRSRPRHRPGDRRPGGGAGRRRRRRAAAAAGIPCFGPTAELARARVRQGLRPRARRATTACPRPPTPFASADRLDEAIAWWRELGRPGGGQARRSGRRQGRDRAADADGDARRRSELVCRVGPVRRARGAPERPGVLAAWRCATASTARPLPLAQDHKRIGEGDTGPEHRRHGRLRAGTRCRHDADELAATFVQPVVDYLRCGRHALRRRALRRADADRRRPAAARVQLPLRRSRGPGRAAAARRPTWSTCRLACCHRASWPTPGRWSPPARHCGVVLAAAGYPAAPRSPSTHEPIDAAADTVIVRGRRPLVVPRRRRRPRVLAVTGVGPAPSPRARDARLRGWSTSLTSTAAGAPRHRLAGARRRRSRSYAAAGVDIDEGNRAVEQHEGGRRAHPRRRRCSRGVGSFGGAFDRQGRSGDGRPGARRLHRRRRHQGRAGGPRSAATRRRARTSSTTASTTCSCRAPRPLFFLDYIAAVGARRRPWWPRWSAGWPTPARPPAARCSAARRPRCRASTARARSTWPARSWAWSSGTTCCPDADVAAGDVLVGLPPAARTPTATRCCASCSTGCRSTSTPSRLDRPLGDALLEPHRSYLGVLGRRARHRLRQGAGPHHRRRPARERAPGAARRRRRRRSSSGPGPCRRCSGSCASWRPAVDTRSCTARSTWASAWSIVVDADRVAELQRTDQRTVVDHR